MKKVIAVDFDGTLFAEEPSRYPQVGKPNWAVVNAAKRAKSQGCELILWTSREGKALRLALNACKSIGLMFDAVNANTAGMIEKWGNDPRKVEADEYWNDRAVRPSEIMRGAPENAQRHIDALQAAIQDLRLQVERLTAERDAALDRVRAA